MSQANPETPSSFSTPQPTVCGSRKLGGSSGRTVAARSVALVAFLVVACGGAGGREPMGEAAGASGSGGAGGSGTGGAGGSGSAAGSHAAGMGSAGMNAAGMGAAGAGAAGAGAQGGGGAAGVELPEGVVGLFPSPGAVSVCVDPALRLSFAVRPILGESGKLQVFDSTAPAEPVVTVDFAMAMVSKSVGGQSYNLPRQIYVDGNDVVLPLDSNALGYGKQFYVTVDEGAIQPGGAFSIRDARAWQFSTHAAAPSGSQLSVALDGSGQFCSWQGALDAVPAGNTAPVMIDVKNGSYHGIVYFSGKHNITLRGESREQTLFSGINNNNLNAGTKVRALVGADGASGFVIEDLGIHNLTPQGGSQAEALRLQDCDQCVIRRVDILSLQDTLLWSGKIYAEDCYIAGNVDFVWGEGAVYFNRCEIKTVGRSGYNVQSRNGAGAYGYVFVDSKITSDPGITDNTLARIDVSEYPDSHVAYVDCTLGSHIAQAGWTISGGPAPASLRFWEYQSRNEAGGLVDVSGRVAGKQISADQAARMRDPKVVLGGWQPPQ
jgi:hypothetical protein